MCPFGVSGGYLSFRLSCILVFSCFHVSSVHAQEIDKAFHSVSSLLRSSLTRCLCQSRGYCADVAISWSLMKSSISLGLKLYLRISHFFVSSYLGTKYGSSYVVVGSVLVDGDVFGVSVGAVMHVWLCFIIIWCILSFVSLYCCIMFICSWLT